MRKRITSVRRQLKRGIWFPGKTSASASCRLLGARPSGRLGVSKPRNLEYSAKVGERATSKRRERRAPLPTTCGYTPRRSADLYTPTGAPAANPALAPQRPFKCESETSETSCVRPKICSERATAFSLPLLLKKEERAGERRRFLSISLLSGSLPARSSRGERGKTPEAFCVPNTTGLRLAATSHKPTWNVRETSRHPKRCGSQGRVPNVPLSTALTPHRPLRTRLATGSCRLYGAGKSSRSTERKL